MICERIKVTTEPLTVREYSEKEIKTFSKEYNLRFNTVKTVSGTLPYVFMGGVFSEVISVTKKQTYKVVLLKTGKVMELCFMTSVCKLTGVTNEIPTIYGEVLIQFLNSTKLTTPTVETFEVGHTTYVAIGDGSTIVLTEFDVNTEMLLSAEFSSELLHRLEMGKRL